jgi:hypothetical protein
MTPAKNIFLHFFDIHYLNEKGINEWKAIIFREASIATRLALLFADFIIIPASSYFESKLCRSIIDNYSDLHFLGIFNLVGNACNLNEFVSLKSKQYKFNETTFRTYQEVEFLNLAVPFSRRTRSSTADIAEQWKNLLISRDIKPFFSQLHGISIQNDIEKLWHETPENLSGKPFIVDNVYPILFPGQESNLFAINTLHSFINQYYFNSYTKEFNAGVVSDLVYLQPNYEITEHDLSLPYKFVIRELVARKKLDDIINARPEDLISIKESAEWNEILISSFEKKYAHYRQLGIITKDHYHTLIADKNGSAFTQINIRGIVNMGDCYNAGQVGAQGPNAHAHDMAFNQVWSQTENKINLQLLADELAALRKEMQILAKNAEDFAELGALANAEIEAKNGNGPKAMEYLAKTGKWALGAAEKIGVGVAIAAIKTALGL